MKYLYWLRQDLRFHDNEVFKWANERGGEILIVYPLPSSLANWGLQRRGFLKQSLEELEKTLKSFNLNLHVTQHSLNELLPTLHKTHQFTHLLYSTEHAFNELRDEKTLKTLANNLAIDTVSFDQSSLIKEADLPILIEKLPKIFTEFKKIIDSNLKVSAPIHEPNLKLSSLYLPQEEIDWGPLAFHPWFQGGEESGMSRIHQYIWETQSILHYDDTRNGMINKDDSSKFSPWLALGAISAREIFYQVKEFEKKHGENKSTYWLIYELLWRDYFKFYAKKYGAKIFHLQGINEKNQKFFEQNKNEFNKWTLGETGEPFIDSNMKELLLTGWMSNRGRQNVSNYLAKTLKLDWTWGADWFEKNLIDYDPCQNWGNWNYTAGVGADPRDRLFNPKSQANAYDPEGLYQKLWLNKGELNGKNI